MAKKRKNDCAVQLGRLGGLATAKKRKRKATPKKARIKRKKPQQASLF
jgi:hypothetical protein